MIALSWDFLVNVWWALVMAFWTGLALYFSCKCGWFRASGQTDFFPFSARQFFVIGASLFFAVAVYISSFLLAHSIVCAVQPLSIGSLASSYREWVVIEQMLGLFLSFGGLMLLVSLLPADLVSIVTGSMGGLKKWGKGFLVGVFFFPVISLICWVVAAISSFFYPGEHPPQVAFDLVMKLTQTKALFWMMTACIVFVVPYVEELVFRGFIQGFLGGLFHPTLNLLFTGAAFALFHYSPLQKGSNIEIISALFVFSLFVSRLRVKENSISAAVGMHSGFNATSMLLFFLQTR